MNCEYCRGALEEGATKCANCGAAVGGREATDYRFCPHCERRLLALGSPACNYCGRALPEEYVRVREQMLRRVGEAGKASPEELEELERGGDDALRRALKSLFDLDDLTRQK